MFNVRYLLDTACASKVYELSLYSLMMKKLMRLLIFTVFFKNGDENIKNAL